MIFSWTFSCHELKLSVSIYILLCQVTGWFDDFILKHSFWGSSACVYFFIWNIMYAIILLYFLFFVQPTCRQNAHTQPAQNINIWNINLNCISEKKLHKHLPLLVNVDCIEYIIHSPVHIFFLCKSKIPLTLTWMLQQLLIFSNFCTLIR